MRPYPRLKSWLTLPLVLLALVLASCAPQQQPVAPAQPADKQPAKQAQKPAEKTKITLAYLDDPSRNTALYAITQGVVKSDRIDVELAFLPLPAAVEAYQTKKYDVIESSPMAVAGGAAAGFQTLITSAALQNKAGTLLYVPADSPIQDARDLRDKTIGLASLGGTFALETRYVLQEKYGLNTNPQGGDVRWQEVPPDVTPGLLKEKKLDAAVLLHVAAWKAREDKDFRVLVDVTEEFVKLTGNLSMNSVLLTYPEVAEKKAPAIRELNRMLRESTDYVHKNQDTVNQAVAKEKNIPADFLNWWWEVYDYAHGSLTDQHKQEVSGVWQAANKIGALKQVPNIDEFVFKS